MMKISKLLISSVILNSISLSQEITWELKLNSEMAEILGVPNIGKLLFKIDAKRTFFHGDIIRLKNAKPELVPVKFYPSIIISTEVGKLTVIQSGSIRKISIPDSYLSEVASSSIKFRGNVNTILWKLQVTGKLQERIRRRPNTISFRTSVVDYSFSGYQAFDKSGKAILISAKEYASIGISLKTYQIINFEGKAVEINIPSENLKTNDDTALKSRSKSKNEKIEKKKWTLTLTREMADLFGIDKNISIKFQTHIDTEFFFGYFVFNSQREPDLIELSKFPEVYIYPSRRTFIMLAQDKQQSNEYTFLKNDIKIVGNKNVPKKQTKTIPKHR